eukprot:scaffold56777_cov64-Phaeocystis_antarctica.AAC.8
MASRSKRQARFWSAILSRLLLGMFFGALGSLMVNCALVEISLSPLFAVAFGATASAQPRDTAEHPSGHPAVACLTHRANPNPNPGHHQACSSCSRAAPSRGLWRSSRAAARAVCCCSASQRW